MKKAASARVVKQSAIANRLVELRGTKTPHAFAIECGVTPKRMGDWLRGANAPNADSIRRVAAAQKVTTDWLLAVPGANQRRDRDGSTADLSLQLSVHLEEKLTDEFPPESVARNSEAHVWIVTGEGALRFAVEGALAAAKQELEIHRRLPKLSRNTLALQHAAAILQSEGNEHARRTSRQLLQLSEELNSEGRAILNACATALDTTGIMLMPAKFVVQESAVPE